MNAMPEPLVLEEIKELYEAWQTCAAVGHHARNHEHRLMHEGVPVLLTEVERLRTFVRRISDANWRNLEHTEGRWFTGDWGLDWDGPASPAQDAAAALGISEETRTAPGIAAR